MEAYSAAGWLGSEAFDGALVHAPCGCDLERRAQRESDEGARRVLLRAAREAQAAWGCHLCGYDEQVLDSLRERTLVAVERLTGWRPPRTTCPRAALADGSILAALRLQPAVDHGTLPLLDHLPAVLHDAAYAVAHGRSERLQYEQHQRELKRGR